MTGSIYILIHSLKYQAEPTRAQIVSRENFARIRAEKRNPDELIERVSAAKFIRESRAIEREQSRLLYDKQIQKKYNVGPGWRDNRWFVEQVRPTI
jgi:hypothetical protein